MNSIQNIAALLKEWLELTRLELHSLQIGRWNDLAKIQTAKHALRASLVEGVAQWKTENPGEAATNPFPNEVSRLLELEARSSELLAVRKREVREKILLLEQALYDIRRVRPMVAAASQAA